MGKKDLTEQEIRSQYIRPDIIDAGWKSAGTFSDPAVSERGFKNAAFKLRKFVV